MALLGWWRAAKRSNPSRSTVRLLLVEVWPAAAAAAAKFEKETNFLKKESVLLAALERMESLNFELVALCRTVAGVEAKFELQEVNSRNSNLRTRIFTE